MTSIKVVGFDWGNVLNDYTRHMKAMAEYLGLSVEKFEAAKSGHVRDFHLGLSEMEFWNRVCSDAGINKPSKPIWYEIAVRTIIINDELFKVVRLLKEKSYEIAMISNDELPTRDYIERHIKGTKYDLFDHYVLSTEVGFVKPEPGIFRYTCEVFGIKPSELVLVDDNSDNVQGAREFGSKAILHTANNQTIKELSDLLEGETSLAS